MHFQTLFYKCYAPTRIINDFGTFLQRLRSSSAGSTRLLDCLTYEPLRRAMFDTTSSIFDLWSRLWGVA